MNKKRKLELSSNKTLLLKRLKTFEIDIIDNIKTPSEAQRVMNHLKEFKQKTFKKYRTFLEKEPEIDENGDIDYISLYMNLLKDKDYQDDSEIDHHDNSETRDIGVNFNFSSNNLELSLDIHIFDDEGDVSFEASLNYGKLNLWSIENKGEYSNKDQNKYVWNYYSAKCLLEKMEFVKNKDVSKFLKEFSIAILRYLIRKNNGGKICDYDDDEFGITEKILEETICPKFMIENIDYKNDNSEEKNNEKEGSDKNEEENDSENCESENYSEDD